MWCHRLTQNSSFGGIFQFLSCTQTLSQASRCSNPFIDLTNKNKEIARQLLKRVSLHWLSVPSLVLECHGVYGSDACLVLTIMWKVQWKQSPTWVASDKSVDWSLLLWCPNTCLWVSWGRRSKVPKTGRLKQQKYIAHSARGQKS